MIAATFHGPNHWSPNHDESTIEVFENIGHAISALFDRYEDKGSRPNPVRYLDGNHGNIIFRGIEQGDSFECYRLTDGPVPDHVGNDTVLDVLTGVHAGLWDYRLVLRRADDASVYITVEKR